MSRGRGGQIALGLFIFLILAPTLFYRTGRSDLAILTLAAQRLWAGEAVYRLEDPNEHTKPPPATLIISPVAWVPQPVLFRLWDLASLLAFAYLLWELVRQAKFDATRPAVFWVLVTWALLLNPYNGELRLGQYNALLFAFLVWAGFGGRAAGAGLALCLAVLFKPTFVLMSPWVLRQSPRPSRTLAAGTALLGALVMAYSLCFGFSQFIDDIRAWVTFLPMSSFKHIARPDNHGLPSFIAVHFGSGFENALLLVGLAISGLAAWKGEALLSLAVCGVAMIVFSPMAWMQNFILLAPGVVWALRRRHSLALGVLWLGIGLLNPTTCQWWACDTWGWARAPLWALLLAATICGVSEISRGLRGGHGRRGVA